ncbi:MAG: Ycf48-like protein [Ignavibacteria bacterium]|nr:Ycf48-like protein [Ignavibacteria bacterium]
MKKFKLQIFFAAGYILIQTFINSVNLNAEPEFFNFNTAGIRSPFPINTAGGNKVQILFLPGEFRLPSPAPAGLIKSISFLLFDDLKPVTFNEFNVKMGQIIAAALPENTWYEGALTTVCYKSQFELSGNNGEWITINFSNRFDYDPLKSLIVEISYCNASDGAGAGIASTSFTGIRQNQSLMNAACPFLLGSQNGYVFHAGINLENPVFNYHWIVQNSGTTNFLYDVKALNDNSAWVCGENRTVLKTTNGGINWTNGNPNTGVIYGHVYVIDAVDENTAWCASKANNAAFIFRTTNGGYNWELQFSQTGGFIYELMFEDRNNGMMVGKPVNQRWTVFKTTNGGVIWDSSGMYLPHSEGEFGDLFCAYKLGSKIFIGTNNYRILYSSNTGHTWSAIYTPFSSRIWAFHFNTPDLGFGCGSNKVIMTTNGGIGFNLNNEFPDQVFALEGVNNYNWALCENYLYFSTNNGGNWSEVYHDQNSFYKFDFPDDPDFRSGWIVGFLGKITKMIRKSLTSEEVNLESPNRLTLKQNYPNPFNPITKIDYEIRKTGLIQLKVYDILGKEIVVLVNKILTSGLYTVDLDGSRFPSGVYLYTLYADGVKMDTKKCLLVK